MLCNFRKTSCNLWTLTKKPMCESIERSWNFVIQLWKNHGKDFLATLVQKHYTIDQLNFAARKCRGFGPF